MPPKVSVVILNYNGRNHLQTFLPSVVETIPNFAKVIIVDNASTDDSLHWLEENHPEIEIMPLQRNLGFAGGYAKALESINSPYYFLLNSDVELTSGCIEVMFDYLERNPNVAAIQPKVLSYENRDVFEHAGANGGFLDSNCYPFCRGRVFDTVETDGGQYDKEIPIFWASGAALFIRSELYHEVGGFDKEFFAHMEEIDLCWRLQRSGYDIYSVPTAKVYHLGGGTLSYKSPFKTYLNFRNNLYMMHKNLPANKRMTNIVVRMILDGIAAVKFLFSGDTKNVQSVFKAHMDYYKKRNYLNAAEKKFLEKNKVFSKKEKLDGWIETDILMQYFIKGQKTFSEIVE